MKQKDNESLLDYSKCLKQAKDIFEARISKYILVDYVENLKEFKDVTVSEDKNTIKYE